MRSYHEMVTDLVNNKKLIFFGITILISILTRIHHLDYESLFMDEVRQVYCSRLDFAEVKKCSLAQQQPPLDYWLGHVVNKVSTSDFAVRLPAALFGIASVGIVFSILAKNVNIYIALCVSLIYALSPFHIYFSQEVRPYSIAIFLFLILLWIIINTLSKQAINSVRFFSIILIGFLFLIARTFSPLCILISLCIMLVYLAVQSFLIKNYAATKNISIILVGLVVAIVFYLPVHMQLTEAVKRYSPEASNIGLKFFIDGIANFDLLPAIQAYFAQMEPFGYIAAPFIVVALFINFREFLRGETNAFAITAALFFISILLQLFIYLAKTSYNLRPPYLINIQPLALLLLVYTLDRLLNLKYKVLKVSFALGALISGAIALTDLSDFKATLKKENWRDLFYTISTQLNGSNIVIFDSLSSRASWKPYMYGSLTYDSGDAVLADMSYIRDNIEAFRSVKAKPVLSLFYYHDFLLTSDSKVPIIKNSGGYPDIDAYALNSSYLNISRFKGFVYIEPKSDNDHFIAATYALIYHAAMILPQNATLVDMLLTASKIEALCPHLKISNFQPWSKVLSIATEADKPYLEQTQKFFDKYADRNQAVQCGQP